MPCQQQSLQDGNQLSKARKRKTQKLERSNVREVNFPLIYTEGLVVSAKNETVGLVQMNP